MAVYLKGEQYVATERFRVPGVEVFVERGDLLTVSAAREGVGPRWSSPGWDQPYALLPAQERTLVPVHMPDLTNREEVEAWLRT